MISDIENNICAKCLQNISIAKCLGCEQLFCTKHFMNHRLDISQRMNELNQKYENFQQDLNQHHFGYSFLSTIYAWERKSMRKIQEIAEQAREDIHSWIKKTKSEVKNTLKQINEQLQIKEKSDDYTELDIEEWTKQLEQLRNLLEKPQTISIVEDDKPSSYIHTIKVIDQHPSPMTSSSNSLEKTKLLSRKSIDCDIQEHFVKVFGPCQLSENDRLVTHSSYRAGLSQITGNNHYSSGKHTIDFLIKNKGIKNMFIGIISSSHKIISPTFDYSVHGWWNLDHTIINGESKGEDSNESFQTGDQITLTIDCDYQKLALEHHRTKRIVHLPIKLEVCPFPWKILVRLLTNGDTIRILS